MANISNELRMLCTLERGSYMADKKRDKSSWIFQLKSHKKKTNTRSDGSSKKFKGTNKHISEGIKSNT
jgi:hypothetical protein